MKTYPVFLIGLEQRRSVVIGGGAEAERKVATLLDCDARVTVIAAQVTPALEALARTGRVAWIRRAYREGDLREAFLVIATDPRDPANEWIHREAGRERALINAVDDVEHCNFIAGSLIRRGDLTVAISTGGCAPALAVRLRESLERELGPEYGELLALLAELRDVLPRLHPEFERRRRIWYDLVDSGALAALREKRRDAARTTLREVLDSHSGRGTE